MASETDPLVRDYFDEPIQTSAVLTAAFACISGLLLGYDIGVTNGALGPISNYFGMADFQKEILCGILNLFALPGCFVGGISADWYGRRVSMGIGASLFLAGNAMMTFAYDFYVLIVGRVIIGFALGMTIVNEPLYTAETAPARLRGVLNTNVELALNVGIVLGFVSSWVFMDFSDETSWRWMFGMSLAFPCISLLALFFVLPESPRWLASRNRLPEAEAALKWLLGPMEAESALRKLASSVEAEEERELSWYKMFTMEETRWLMFIGGGLVFFSQASGVETVTYYSDSILKEAGLSRGACLLATIVMGLVKLVGVVISCFFVDSYGRRPLLFISSTGVATAMGILGLAFSFTWSWEYKVFSMGMFGVFFSLGFGPIVYIFNAEIYAKNCRAKGLIFALAMGRAASSAVSMSFFSLARLLTYAGMFYFYAAMAVVSVAFIMRFVPETKGTNLEDQDLKQMHA